MFWKTLNLVVNLTFLLLAITIMTILLRNDSQRGDFSNYESVLEDTKREVNKVNQSNFMYLEEKISRTSSNQDSYQLNISRRLDVLEERMKSLQNRRTETSRIINNNSAYANTLP